MKAEASMPSAVLVLPSSRRAAFAFCPELTRLLTFRYHASRGNPKPGEEVRDGSHAGDRGGVAPTAPLLRLRAGALRGSGLCRI
jgi:hypothetical protein